MKPSFDTIHNIENAAESMALTLTRLGCARRRKSFI
jgi:hypothetical protein